MTRPARLVLLAAAVATFVAFAAAYWDVPWVPPAR